VPGAISADDTYTKKSVVPLFSSIGDVTTFDFATGQKPGGGQASNQSGGGIFGGTTGPVAYDPYGSEPIDDTKINGALREAYEPILIDAIKTIQVFQVREYAHHHESSASGARADFAETLYWNPLVITGSDGKATIKFDLSDAVAK